MPRRFKISLLKRYMWNATRQLHVSWEQWSDLSTTVHIWMLPQNTERKERLSRKEPKVYQGREQQEINTYLYKAYRAQILW